MDIILFIKKIILAIIQGIAEVLPISSSGHLLISSEILNVETQGLQFIIFLHFGSLVAMVIYYWKDLINILFSLCRFIFKKDREENTLFNCRLFINLIIASIPAAVLGILFSDIIDEYLSNLYFVFSFLIITGCLLLINRNLNGTKTLKEMTALDALTVGSFQCVGILPGISRSGSTIFGGKVTKLSNEAAANFSFLMFLPVTAGSFLIEVVKEFDTIIATEPINLLLDAIVVIISGIVTFLAVKFIFKLIKKGKLHYFAYYCFAIALIGIIICLCTSYGF